MTNVTGLFYIGVYFLFYIFEIEPTVILYLWKMFIYTMYTIVVVVLLF